MAKKETAAKKVAKEEIKKVEDTLEINPNAELIASLENIADGYDDLASKLRTHAKLARENGRHPARYVRNASLLEAAARQLKKDIRRS